MAKLVGIISIKGGIQVKEICSRGSMAVFLDSSKYNDMRDNLCRAV